MIFDEAQQAELRKYTFSVYILQALGFVLLITPFIGVIINYIKQDDVRGGNFESHFRWQKATFWYGLLWILLGLVTLPFLIGYVVLAGANLWLIYRIARGWIYLVDGKQMYPATSGEFNE